jgi:hypothetical protein
MDPTCTKKVIMQNPCNSWNPWLLLAAPKPVTIFVYFAYAGAIHMLCVSGITILPGPR